MLFTALPLRGAFLMEPERREDERGFFARSYCREEFLAHGLNPALVQCNISFNVQRGTLRGMHYQKAPFEEAKVVRCTMGALFDVIVDLRPASVTFRKWHGVELTAENRWSLYVPEGFAHGFLTLADETEVLYQMSTFYEPSAAAGVRWNDPALSIVWPGEVAVISERDGSYADFAS
jgi:dTDP-4-dehydrorhamnose 3,5-epimerase